MTYSFNTLNTRSHAHATANRPSTYRTIVARFGHEMGLLLSLACLTFWVLALVSYSAQDPAWSTSGMITRNTVANWGGRIGAWLADSSYFMLGFSTWWAVAVAAFVWLRSLARWLRASASEGETATLLGRLLFWVGLLLLLGASTALEWTRLYRLEPLLPGHAGGVLGYVLGLGAMRWLGFTGSGLLAISVAVLGVSLVFGFSWGQVAEAVGARIAKVLRLGRSQYEKNQDKAVGKRAARQREEVVKEQRKESTAQRPHPVPIIEPTLENLDDLGDRTDRADATDSADSADSTNLPVRAASTASTASTASSANATTAQDTARMAKERLKPLMGAKAAAQAAAATQELAKQRAMPRTQPPPPVDLLDPAPEHQDAVDAETLEMTSRLIEKKLKDFGVEVRVVATTPGPVITRYEIALAKGVKGSQVTGLAKDLARSLSLVSVRVVEAVPGKTTMALELPNVRRQTIGLTEILSSSTYREAQSLLSVGLGKNNVGAAVVVDLAKMPHCLVAGTTGSGKSVGINAMILSLLYKADPSQVRLMLIDPKMLEMSVYQGIGHLLCPVITNMKQAANGLAWCAMEMDRRYQLMSELGVRNLAGYNANAAAMEPLPYIVVVIDELADLMMVAGKEAEALIARLAQKARAAGIHLILATQRPSADVITGLIKANIPTRIAFQVSSKIDSRIILDQMGAETLLGMGDMLYLTGGGNAPLRVHGAFVSDEEVHRVVSHLKAQGGPQYIPGILDPVTEEQD